MHAHRFGIRSVSRCGMSVCMDGRSACPPIGSQAEPWLGSLLRSEIHG